MAAVRVLSKELQQKANEELYEDETRIQEDLEHIRDWLKKQPHLNAKQDDQFLISFGRACKWSLQVIKDKLDGYYTVRTLLPDIYANRDPCSPDVQSILQAGIICPLPNLSGSVGPRLIFYDYSSPSLAEIPNFFINFIKVTHMTIELLLHTDDNTVVSGMESISNLKHYPISCITQCKPSVLSKVVKLPHQVLPLRKKRFIALNATPVIEAMFNFFKPLLSEKFNKGVIFVKEGNMDKAYKELDKSLFPIEYGGTNGSITEISRQWKLKMESYREWFLDDAQYKSNEKLQLTKSKYSFDELGMEGSFRKLTID